LRWGYIRVVTDWYRNTDWNDAIETHFFEMLSRARSQRDQYLVLQAHHLSASYPEVALRLVDQYFATRTDDFHDARALRVSAAAHFAMDGHVQALDNYLRMFSGEDAARDLHVGSPIEFAFLTARYRSTAHYAAAIEQLAPHVPRQDDPPDLRFRFWAASALLLEASGKDPGRALTEARLALQTTEEVLANYADVVWRLRGITRS
jgi:hypothetical protein